MWSNTQVLQLSAVQGSAEQRSELYKKYSERVAEALTPQCANSAAGLTALLAGGLCGAKDAL